MSRSLVLFGLALALLAAGCGSSGGGSTASTSSSASDGPVTKVSMKNIQFNPKTVTVNVGTTVEWVNDDSVSHDVTKDTGPGPPFSSGSGNLGGGDTYKITFNAPGTVGYECTVHPGMSGMIIVK
jgi:plastocyanin